MQWRGVRLSVRPSVCKLLRKSLLLADTWPDRHQTCTGWSPDKRASRVCSRSLHWLYVTPILLLRVLAVLGLTSRYSKFVHHHHHHHHRQGQRSRDTRTFLDSWNELLRHWRSGSYIFLRAKVSWPPKVDSASTPIIDDDEMMTINQSIN